MIVVGARKPVPLVQLLDVLEHGLPETSQVRAYGVKQRAQLSHMWENELIVSRIALHLPKILRANSNMEHRVTKATRGNQGRPTSGRELVLQSC